MTDTASGTMGQGHPFLRGPSAELHHVDRYFASILGPTYPNRLFLLAAQTDRLYDTLTLTTLPTILDRLQLQA